MHKEVKNALQEAYNKGYDIQILPSMNPGLDKILLRIIDHTNEGKIVTDKTISEDALFLDAKFVGRSIKHGVKHLSQMKTPREDTA